MAEAAEVQAYRNIGHPHVTDLHVHFNDRCIAQSATLRTCSSFPVASISGLLHHRAGNAPPEFVDLIMLLRRNGTGHPQLEVGLE
jgi:hypothetical protein